MGATQFLPHLVGLSQARRCILSGRSITAQEAYQMGLICKVTEDESSVVDEAIKEGSLVAENGPFAVQSAKKAIWQGVQINDYQKGWDNALKLYKDCAESEE